ncbi:hypothetical protein AURDEDRAFT_187701 [Auricularia subglabra TFB-10046 SS5]|nr:hypothetical protein AURDEDRAFT_187701 [Auricularia subglabra TFB-10046 SS5]
MGMISHCTSRPPSAPIVSDAYLGGSDLSGLGYCSGIADDSSSLNASYFVMVTEDFFNYYSPLCGSSVRISFKTTIRATIIDAVSCTLCGGQDVILNYAAYSALTGCDPDPGDRLPGVIWSFSGSHNDPPLPAPPSCTGPKSSVSSPENSRMNEPTSSAREPEPTSHLAAEPTSQPPDNAAPTTATQSSAPQGVKGSSSSLLPATPTHNPANSSPSPMIQATPPSPRAESHRSAMLVLGVLLTLAFMILPFLFIFYRHMRARRNRVTTDIISRPQRERTPIPFPYYVGDQTGYDTSTVYEAALWNDKDVDRGGYLEPVPVPFLQPAPARPSRPQSLVLDIERSPTGRHFSLTSLSCPESVEFVGPSSSPF